MEQTKKTKQSNNSKSASENRDNDACQLLWFAVLMQLITDAKSEAACPRAQANKQAALEWLDDLENNEDFTIICELAGLDPAKVEFEINQILASYKAKPDFRTLRKYFIRRKSKRSARDFRALSRNRQSDSERVTNSIGLAQAS